MAGCGICGETSYYIIMAHGILNNWYPMRAYFITGTKHHVLSASTDALEMDESESYVDMTTQAKTDSQTINNIAYEGVTSNNEETEGATHYINGDFQSDTHVYECI